MSLTVRTNLSAMRGYHSLNRTQNHLNGTLDRISTGLRVVRAADDAAGLGVATNLSAQSVSLEQAMRNANDGISIIQTAEGASNEVSNILSRMRELAVQSASDTLADSERTYINDEFLQLSQEIDRIAQVTEFNGIQLTNNTFTSLSAQIGIESATTSRIDIILGDLRSTVLGVATTSMSLNTATDARTAIDTIDSAIATVSSYRSGLGSVQNRLESSLSNSTTYLESLRAAESQIMDADFAKESTDLTKQQIMQQAGVASLAQAKNINQAVTSLLN
ncbi:MAG: flagellin [Myxococcota bacterium]